MGSHDAEEELQIRVMELEAEVETHLSDKVKLRAEIERLRALKKSIEVQEHLLHGRIEAALAIYESAMEIPPLAERMADALKGGE